MDEEPDDRTVPGTATWTAGPDYAALLATAEAVLDDVDRALARLDQGTYGTCEVCGAVIDEDRLVVGPTTRTCGAHPAPTGEPDAG